MTSLTQMADTKRVKTMRAAVRDRLGNVEMQSAVPVPTPAKGQVLIRVRAAALNPIDFKYPQFLGGLVPGQVLPEPHTSPNSCFVQALGCKFYLLNGGCHGPLVMHSSLATCELHHLTTFMSWSLA